MSRPLQTVVELPQFIRDARAAGVSDDERRAIVDAIAADPVCGDVIRGSGGVRKVRSPDAAKARAAAIGW